MLQSGVLYLLIKNNNILDAAEQDKERYNREFSDYKQTEAYRLFSEKQSSEKQQENKKERNGTDINSEQNDIQQDKDNDFTGFDIPIFTEEFWIIIKHVKLS